MIGKLVEFVFKEDNQYFHVVANVEAVLSGNCPVIVCSANGRIFTRYLSSDDTDTLIVGMNRSSSSSITKLNYYKIMTGPTDFIFKKKCSTCGYTDFFQKGEGGDKLRYCDKCRTKMSLNIDVRILNCHPELTEYLKEATSA